MTSSFSFRPWLLASRPRTLLLATASIGMAAFLAASREQLNVPIVLLAWLTATLLQILSNLANDYGDARHGIDKERVGPTRAVQSGLISSRQMLIAVVLASLLAVVTGLSLVILAFGIERLPVVLLFVALGGLGIWAAIAYTATDNPYGYVGLGDIMVLIFFGYVAVLGTYFLQTTQLGWDLVLPASSSGLLAVAVLNVNNIRDLESDRKAGKRSIPVRLGPVGARVYHSFLLGLSVVAAFIYVLLRPQSGWQYLFLLTVPFLGLNLLKVWQGKTPQEIAPLLKQMSLSSLVFTLVFGLGQVL